MIMRICYFLISLFLLVETYLYSQNGGYCGSDIVHQNEISKNSVIKTNFEKFNLEWQTYASASKARKRTNVVVLPIIFHLMTTNSYKASSVLNNEAALTKIVTMLNDVYSGKVVGNKAAGVNTNIQFCLAKIDALGQKINSYVYDCPALDKHVMKLEESGLASSVLKKTGKFPTNKYINVYVVEDIVSPVAGFATLPSSHGELNDGIYIEASYLIDNTAKNSTVLSHEMGHYLGLLHTFGRCSEFPELTLKACACDNSNCLVDGDMVCDTPPDFSIQAPTNGCSNPPNTCNTDAVSTVNDPDAPFPTSDVNDLVNNYMDYGNWDCQYTFTKGQINRMHYSIDAIVGARNSLLNSSVCNVACEELCKLSIKSPSTKINGNDVANTLQLTSTQVTFDFKNNSCSQQYKQLLWKVIDLSTNKEISSSTNSAIAFNKLGNFRIIAEAKNTTTTPTCVQSQSIDIQVLPLSRCLPNSDLSNGWGKEWQRVEIDGGWQRDYNNKFILSSSKEQLITTQPTTRTAIVSSLASDPNFKNIKNPQGVSKIFRVGDIINNETVRVDGAATYVTYTFTPTPSNSKFRVYYIGMRHNTTAGQNIYHRNFTQGDPIGTQPAFGYISHYEITKSDGQKLSLQPIYNKYLGGFNNLNDIPEEYFTKYIPSPFVANYKIMPDWQFADLDFSEYSCGNTTVTVTFYALTDSGKSPGKLHSYGYFAIGNCSPGIPKEIELANKNYYLGCETCIDLELPTAYYFGDYYKEGVFDVSVQTSFDEQNWINSSIDISGWNNYTLKLCKTPDKNKFKYFKINYKKVCGSEKTSNVVIEQGFEHSPKSPCDNSGTLLTIQDKYFQYCGKDKSTLPDLNLNDPCWVTASNPGKYKWQYSINGGSSWNDIYTYDVNSGSKLLRTKGFIPSSPGINFLKDHCSFLVKRIAYYEDPYCPGNPIEVPSEIVKYTDLSLAFSGTIEKNDVCGNITNTFTLKNIYFDNCFSGDEEIKEAMSKGPNSVEFTAKINDKIIGTVKKNVDNKLYYSSIDFSFFDKNILKNGDNVVFIDYNYKNVYGCENKGTIRGTIHRNPSAVAGTISLVKNTCTQTVFEGTNDNNDDKGVSWGYSWEYSYDNFTNDIQTFPNSNTSGFTLPNIKYPVYIRRKAIGPKTDCVTPAFTEVQYIDKNSSVDNFTVTAATFCPGKPVKLEISSSNFSFPLTIKAVGDQTNIQQQVLTNNNFPITLNLTNITKETRLNITLNDSKCSETRFIDLIPAKAAKIGITSNSKNPSFDEINNLYTLNFCLSDDLKNHKITASSSYSQYNWTSSGKNLGTLNTIPATSELLYNLKVYDAAGCSNETNVKVSVSLPSNDLNQSKDGILSTKGNVVFLGNHAWDVYLCGSDTQTDITAVEDGKGKPLYKYQWYTKNVLYNQPIVLETGKTALKYPSMKLETAYLNLNKNIHYLIITDANGCQSTNTVTLKKIEDGTLGVINTTETICNDLESSVELTANVVDNSKNNLNSKYDFKWSTNGLTNPIKVKASGTYNVTASNKTSKCTLTGTKTITVKSIDFTLTDVANICPGQTATITMTLKNVVASEISQCYWVEDDNLQKNTITIAPNATSIKFNISFNPAKKYTVYMVTKTGCMVSKPVNVSYKSTPDITFEHNASKVDENSQTGITTFTTNCENDFINIKAIGKGIPKKFNVIMSFFQNYYEFYWTPTTLIPNPTIVDYSKVNKSSLIYPTVNSTINSQSNTGVYVVKMNDAFCSVTKKIQIIKGPKFDFDVTDLSVCPGGVTNSKINVFYNLSTKKYLTSDEIKGYTITINKKVISGSFVQSTSDKTSVSFGAGAYDVIVSGPCGSITKTITVTEKSSINYSVSGLDLTNVNYMCKDQIIKIKVCADPNIDLSNQVFSLTNTTLCRNIDPYQTSILPVSFTKTVDPTNKNCAEISFKSLMYECDGFYTLSGPCIETKIIKWSTKLPFRVNISQEDLCKSVLPTTITPQVSSGSGTITNYPFDYSWSPSNPEVKTNSFTITQPGDYTLTVKDKCGNPTSKTIHVSSGTDISFVDIPGVTTQIQLNSPNNYKANVCRGSDLVFQICSSDLKFDLEKYLQSKYTTLCYKKRGAPYGIISRVKNETQNCITFKDSVSEKPGCSSGYNFFGSCINNSLSLGIGFTTCGLYELKESKTTSKNIDYSVSIYPNPSNGDFEIVTNHEAIENYKIIIYDLAGKEIYTKNMIDQASGVVATQINLSNNKLANGLYSVKIYINDEVINQKIQINN